MRPMGFRLRYFDEAKFHYTEEELDADLVEIKATIEDLKNTRWKKSRLLKHLLLTRFKRTRIF